MTPRARSSAVSAARRTTAPRGLNDPVFWNSSSLSQVSAAAALGERRGAPERRAVQSRVGDEPAGRLELVQRRERHRGILPAVRRRPAAFGSRAARVEKRRAGRRGSAAGATARRDAEPVGLVRRLARAAGPPGAALGAASTPTSCSCRRRRRAASTTRSPRPPSCWATSTSSRGACQSDKLGSEGLAILSRLAARGPARRRPAGQPPRRAACSWRPCASAGCRSSSPRATPRCARPTCGRASSTASSGSRRRRSSSAATSTPVRTSSRPSPPGTSCIDPLADDDQPTWPVSRRQFIAAWTVVTGEAPPFRIRAGPHRLPAAPRPRGHGRRRLPDRRAARRLRLRPRRRVGGIRRRRQRREPARSGLTAARLAAAGRRSARRGDRRTPRRRDAARATRRARGGARARAARGSSAATASVSTGVSTVAAVRRRADAEPLGHREEGAGVRRGARRAPARRPSRPARARPARWRSWPCSRGAARAGCSSFVQRMSVAVITGMRWASTSSMSARSSTSSVISSPDAP